MPRSADTTPEAEAAQIAALRRMSGNRRTMIGAELSMTVRSIALSGIRSRHPEYDDSSARYALFRLMLGDELFRRAWPAAPLLAP